MTNTDEQRLEQRLSGAIAPLLKAPLGSAAAITGSVGPSEATVFGGTLWDGGPAADKGTRFNVASVSKVLTAARVVSLAQMGVLGLEDPVSKHLPGVRLLASDGSNRASTITVRQLLQHRSGVPHQPKDLEAKVSDWSAPDLLRKLTDAWDITLDGTPGQYHYSNLGYALLGAIVERTRSCSFADCMAGYLHELGMTESTFWPATLSADAAQGRVASNGSVTFHPPTWYGSRYALPFNGLWTSMPDLVRFGSVLIAASRVESSPLHAMTGDTPVGVFRGNALDAPSLEHDGSGPGFHAALIVVPSKDVVLALATNGGDESKEATAAFGNAMRGAIQALP